MVLDGPRLEAPGRLPGLLLLAGLSVVMASCGFTPRGSISGASELGAIYVDATRNVPISALIRQEIINRELTLARTRDKADILVRLTNEAQSRRILSVQSEGRVSEFELRHSVSLLVAQGKDDQPARYDPEQRANTVTVLREYTYDETGVLGKADEAQILRGEMRKELARDILLRVVATTRGNSLPR